MTGCFKLIEYPDGRMVWRLVRIFNSRRLAERVAMANGYFVESIAADAAIGAEHPYEMPQRQIA